MNRDESDEAIEAAVHGGQLIERQYRGVWGWHPINKADALIALAHREHAWLRVVPHVRAQDDGDAIVSLAMERTRTFAVRRKVRVQTPTGGCIAVWVNDEGQPVVACAQHPTPPSGTPGPRRHAGNSTPARAPVVGVDKSERVGERDARK